MSRRALPDVTLVCVDCANPSAAVRAMRLSLDACDFADALLFTDSAIDAGPARSVPIETIASKERSSEFIFRDLARHIQTSHVLMIAWDGYVIDPGAWIDEFLRYDYIGARWTGRTDDLSIGDGGFSLRSKRLLDALQDPRFTTPGHPEDELICRTYRRQLEDEFGIIFADPMTADRFAFGRHEPRGPTFGFHGVFNLDRVVAEPDLAALLDLVNDEFAKSPEMAELLLKYFRRDRMEAAELVLDRITRHTRATELEATLDALIERPVIARAVLHALGLAI